MSIEEECDQFDRLPDAVVSLIFHKLRDAKSLCRCTLVCKRFAPIVPEIDSVFLTVPRKSLSTSKQSSDQITKSNHSDGRRRSKSILKGLIRKMITRPLQFLLSANSLRSSSSSSLSEDDDCSYYLPNEILKKNFKAIQFLQIELSGHCGNIGSNSGDSLLKWRTEYGSELESCVILGAKSFHRSSQNSNNSQENEGQEEQGRHHQHLLLTNDELKVRVVWTISCLIAASSRHHLVHQIVSEHQTLRSLSVTDAGKQGRLRMSKEQIEELRTSNMKSSDLLPPSERTPVPALNMKLWYVPVLELRASRCVMKGATLVVIRPVDGGKKAESDGDLVERVFNGEEKEEDQEEDEKVFGEAVRKMMKKKNSYTLEMNAF